MSHQPFEDWLLADEPLSSGEARNLNAHLATCDSCASLAEAWSHTRRLLLETPQAVPAPGFARRWEARLAEKRALQQRRRMWIITGLLMALALVIFLAAAGPSLVKLTPAFIINSILTSAILFIARALGFQEAFSQVLGMISPSLPLVVYILFAASFSILAIIWATALWRIIVPKGVKA